MRVMFVAMGCEQLSIGQLSAILRRTGHHVGLAFSRHLFDDRLFLRMPRLARLFADDDILDQIQRFRPDVLCFSALTVTYEWMVEVARDAREATGAVVIFGGVHASAVPQVVAAHEAIDYVVVGEADVALPHLLDQLRKGPVDRPLPNIVFQRHDGTIVRGPVMPFFPNLDALPPFEKDLWRGHIPLDFQYLTMSSRGCPYRCSFCFNNFFAKLPGPKKKAGNYVRQRSVDHFMAELKHAKKTYGMKYVRIVDDIFTLDTAWLKEFAVQYRHEIGLPFRCLSHPRFLDEERVNALKEAGCAWIQVGVQSADDQYKKEIRRMDRNDDIDRVLELLDGAGIEAKLDHMFDLIGEPDSAQDAALDLYSRHNIGRISTYWLTYIPGTETMDQGLAAGKLTQSDVEDIHNGKSTFFYRDGNVTDEKRRHRLLAYEFVFRLLPLLPKGALRHVNVERLTVLPPAVLRTVGLGADTVASLLRQNPELLSYMDDYASGLKSHALTKLGRPPWKYESNGDLPPVIDEPWRRAYAPIAEALLTAVEPAPIPQRAQRRLHEPARVMA